MVVESLLLCSVLLAGFGISGPIAQQYECLNECLCRCMKHLTQTKHIEGLPRRPCTFTGRTAVIHVFCPTSLSVKLMGS